MAKKASAKKVETLEHADDRSAIILPAAQGACSRRLCIPDMLECGNRA